MQDHPMIDDDPLDLSAELLAWIKPELDPGEQILWASYSGSKPAVSVAKLAKQGIVTFVSFGISGLSVLFIDGVYKTTPVPTTAFFILLYVIGILVGSTFFVFALGTLIFLIDGGETIGPATYALTKSRAIIWKTIRYSEAVDVIMFYRGSIKTLHRLEYRDGSGDLSFNHPPEDNLSQPRIAFKAIANVRRVEELVRHFLFLPDSTDSANIL